LAQAGCAVARASMIPKKPAPDVIRGGYRFSDKIMLDTQKRPRRWIE
jgi:hypothetical protein